MLRRTRTKTVRVGFIITQRWFIIVQIGTIEYQAKVTGVEEARQDTEDLQESQAQLGETTQESAASMNNFAGTVEETGDEVDTMGEETSEADTNMRLLGSTSHFVTGLLGGLITKVVGASGVLGGLAGAAGAAKAALSGLTISGVLGSVSGALGSFAGWLAAGSAGALAFAGALGFGLGLLGVWALEVTGALDAVKGFGNWVANKLPPSVKDGILQVLSIITGPLAVAGAFITGFIEDGFSGGFKKAKKVIDIFVGAWKRQLGRVEAFLGGTVEWIKSTWNRGVKRVGKIWGRGVDRVKKIWSRGVDRVGKIWDRGVQRLKNGYNDLKNSVIGFFGDMEKEAKTFASNVEKAVVNTVRSGFNSVVPDNVSLPSATIDVPEVAGGGSFTIGGQSLDLPQLQVGGMVEETGAAVVHKGEAVIPEPIVDASVSGGGATGGSGGGVVIENMRIELMGDFDPSNISRREVERLADRIAEELGGRTKTQAGTR